MFKATLAPMAHKVFKAPRDCPAPKVRKALPVQLAMMACRGRKAPRVLPVRRGARAILV